jgi:mRNA interferase MazF
MPFVVTPREPREGDIWYVDFSPHIGREQGGVRPALVVSNDAYNAVPNGLHIICPLTTRDRDLAYHVRLDAMDGVLTRPSVIMCEQVRAQSIDRFVQHRGPVPADVLDRVRTIIGMFFVRTDTPRNTP